LIALSHFCKDEGNGQESVNGAFSSWSVTTWICPSSITFINDFPSAVTNPLLQFAGNTKIYSVVDRYSPVFTVHWCMCTVV